MKGSVPQNRRFWGLTQTARACSLRAWPASFRVQYPDAIYHVMNRGDRREPIFKDDLDRRRFLQTLAQACAKTAWQVHAYCLMENHFHLVVETPRANLVAGMKWFLGTYTSRFNRIWETKNSGRNCWRKWNRNWGGIMADRSDRRPTRRGPSECWARNSGAEVGPPTNWKRCAKEIERK